MDLKKRLPTIFNFFLLAVIAYHIFFFREKSMEPVSYGPADELVLTTSGKLLNATGQLNEIGWSRHYLKEFRFEDVQPIFLSSMTLTKLKYKRFNYYAATFNNSIIQIGVANLGYAATVFCNVYNFDTRTYVKEKINLFPLAHSAQFPQLIDNPFDCRNDTFTVSHKDLYLQVTSEVVYDICTINIKLQWEDKINAQLKIYKSSTHEGLYEHKPRSEDHRYFFYTGKTYNTACDGQLALNGDIVNITRSKCLGTLDFGRGIMPYRTTWLWCAASGYTTLNEPISLNLGMGTTEFYSGIADNAFIIGSRVVKLNPLDITFDQKRLMKNITFTTVKSFKGLKNHANITFVPYTPNMTKTNYLVVSANLSYLYGVYTGTVYDDEGQAYTFENIPGVAEIADLWW